MWQPPKTGCEVTRYNITHQLINYDQCNETVSETKWRTKRGTRRQVSLGSNAAKEVILPYSTYNVSVIATSLDGIGESHIFQVTTGSTSKLKAIKKHV